jgi:hypothetical protein
VWFLELYPIDNESKFAFACTGSGSCLHGSLNDLVGVELIVRKHTTARESISFSNFQLRARLDLWNLVDSESYCLGSLFGSV